MGEKECSSILDDLGNHNSSTWFRFKCDPLHSRTDLRTLSVRPDPESFTKMADFITCSYAASSPHWQTGISAFVNHTGFALNRSSVITWDQSLCDKVLFLSLLRVQAVCTWPVNMFLIISWLVIYGLWQNKFFSIQYKLC